MSAAAGPGRGASRLFLEMTGPFGRRHASGVAVIRLLVSIWLCGLAIGLYAYGHWWGLLLIAAAAGVFWFAYNGRRLALYGER